MGDSLLTNEIRCDIVESSELVTQLRRSASLRSRTRRIRLVGLNDSEYNLI